MPHSNCSSSVHLAIDLGAGSGRVVAAEFNGKTMKFHELARFTNPSIEILGHCHWNLLTIFQHILDALKLAGKEYGKRLESCAISTWGVDFGLVDENGRLSGLPHQYRDPRTQGMEQLAESKMDLEEVYQHTGIQNVFFNTSYQLLAEVERNYSAFHSAKRLLFTPELIAYWLTGVMAHERSICSTSQLYNPNTGDWAWEVIDAFQIPRHLFGKVHEAGHKLGPLTKALARQINAPNLQVIAGASHDTAACVAGLPIPADKSVAWISSGTWSLFGAELKQPLCTEEARKAGFSNEQGVAGTTRFLSNISGLWLIQQCREAWQQELGEEIDYGDLVAEARRAKPLTALLDPDDKYFREAGNMPSKIVTWLENTGQDAPATSERGRIARIIIDSLALRYRKALNDMEALLDSPIEQIHIGGGGSANDLLNQATANACKLPVIAGPMEATSSGNIITQLVALGKVANFDEARQIVSQSFPTERFEPKTNSSPIQDWDGAEKRFEKLKPNKS